MPRRRSAWLSRIEPNLADTDVPKRHGVMPADTFVGRDGRAPEDEREWGVDGRKG